MAAMKSGRSGQARSNRRSERDAPTLCIWDNGVLYIRGALNGAQLSAFKGGLAKMVESRDHEVLVDFTQCRYLSSVFIGQLVDSILSAKEKGKIVYVNASPEIGRFLRMAHLHHLFDFEVVGVDQTAVESGLMSATL